MRVNRLLLARVPLLLLVSLSASSCVTDHLDHEPGNVLVASIGDYNITETDVEAAWRERAPAEYARAKQDAYRLRRRVLDELIAEHLLEQRVERLDLTTEELIAEAIESGALPDLEPVKEAEVVALYEQSGAAEHGVSLDQLRATLVDALEEARRLEAQGQYLDLLRRQADIRILMDIPRASISVTPDDPTRGSPDALITLVEFSDFHCSFCRELRPLLEHLMAEYGDHLQWVWKDYPLGSVTTAAAARCAHDQGMFWAYHDSLFDRQGELLLGDVQLLHALAAEIGLNETRFANCLYTGRYEEIVEAEAEAGFLLGVSGTPTVFINGRMLTGAESFETYERVLLDELQLLRGVQE